MYHIFKVFPNKTTQFVESHSTFKQARTIIKDMRGKITVSDNYQLKMIFASNQQTGAKLLTTEREFVTYGDD